MFQDTATRRGLGVTPWGMRGLRWSTVTSTLDGSADVLPTLFRGPRGAKGDFHDTRRRLRTVIVRDLKLLIPLPSSSSINQPHFILFPADSRTVGTVPDVSSVTILRFGDPKAPTQPLRSTVVVWNTAVVRAGEPGDFSTTAHLCPTPDEGDGPTCGLTRTTRLQTSCVTDAKGGQMSLKSGGSH